MEHLICYVASNSSKKECYVSKMKNIVHVLKTYVNEALNCAF